MKPATLRWTTGHLSRRSAKLAQQLDASRAACSVGFDPAKAGNSVFDAIEQTLRQTNMQTPIRAA